ncbi:hypothetical protein AOLI_G00250240 [Acnodon oligacanthus]
MRVWPDSPSCRSSHPKSGDPNGHWGVKGMRAGQGWSRLRDTDCHSVHFHDSSRPAVREAPPKMCQVSLRSLGMGSRLWALSQSFKSMHEIAMTSMDRQPGSHASKH